MYNCVSVIYNQLLDLHMERCVCKGTSFISISYLLQLILESTRRSSPFFLKPKPVSIAACPGNELQVLHRMSPLNGFNVRGNILFLGHRSAAVTGYPDVLSRPCKQKRHGVHDEREVQRDDFLSSAEKMLSFPPKYES